MKKSELLEAVHSSILKKSHNLFHSDFLLTWDKTFEELCAEFLIADVLKEMRRQNLSSKIYDSGLAVSIFRDKSTRTRFSFMSAANLLGLGVQDLDETKTQIAHGETVRETANMISFLTEVIGIRDDMYLGEGHSYMLEVSHAVNEGYEKGILPQLPTLVNLQCDIDHPTQSMADFLHLLHYFGTRESDGEGNGTASPKALETGLDNLEGKKIAMSWAYSPSYGKPLSVPQGVIGLFTRFGMEVVLAAPPGYELIPEVVEMAGKNASESGGSFKISDNMDDAFENADIVYPKSWAPYTVMQRRTDLLKNGDMKGLEDLEREALDTNRRHIDWECTEERMRISNDALYLHCLPADISGISCEHGEVDASVFEKFREQLYRQAGNKPYIIAAMMFLSKIENPGMVLEQLIEKGCRRTC